MTNYEKLKELYDEIDVLCSHNVTAWDPEFRAWHTKAKRFLYYKYGETSFEYNDFVKRGFSLSAYTDRTPQSSFVDACTRGLKATKIIFKSYLIELAEDASFTKEEKMAQMDFSKIFIVHGHDNALKQEVARLIEQQDDIEAIILSEQRNQGKTIIEKIEESSDVAAAICLFTGDDLGRAKEDKTDCLRARQNVVFEAGYFMGKLGRDRIIFIRDGEIELLSDLQGVVYEGSKNWQYKMLQELKEMGYKIDLNKAKI